MRIATRRAVLVALVATIASCAPFSPAELETEKWVLSKTPLQVPEEQTRAATLLIFAPQARPIYDTTRMVYSARPYQIAYFSKAEWAERPSRMIQPLLVQTLRKTRYFTEVLAPPYAGRYTHALQSEILELRQDFTSSPATLNLVMRFRLSAETLDQVLATREISVREPMLERTSQAGVVAANNATAKVLQELARFVIEAMNNRG